MARMKLNSTTPAGRENSRIIMVAAVIAVVAVVAVGIRVFGGADASANRKEVCSLASTAQRPLLDTTKSNSRADLAAALRDRAGEFNSAAGKTSGQVHKAFALYAKKLGALADSIDADKSGKSLLDTITAMSTDVELKTAETTIGDIISNQCS